MVGGLLFYTSCIRRGVQLVQSVDANGGRSPTRKVGFVESALRMIAERTQTFQESPYSALRRNST